MLDFIVVGLPRSGTTWTANLLTTDGSHCLHDPLHLHHYLDWDRVAARTRARRGGNVRVGVSCTAVWRWVEWLNCHPAPKLVLRRDFDDVCRSLESSGIPQAAMPPECAVDLLDRVEGLHVEYEMMFDTGGARAAWERLLPDMPFDPHRHAELSRMRVEPVRTHTLVEGSRHGQPVVGPGILVDADLNRRLLAELEGTGRL